MKLAWLTDIHLNLAERAETQRMIRSVRTGSPDAVIICGDIGEAPSVASYLCDMATSLRCPIYFVLGNHDFYSGAITVVRDRVREACKEHHNLHYLPDASFISLSVKTALVGHDGWADGRYGDFMSSGVVLNDYLHIRELTPVGGRGRTTRPKDELLTILRRLADEAAAHFRAVLPEALSSHDHVIVATHVPPFRESCRYRGKESDPNLLPHYSSKIVGDVLLAVMHEYPEKQLTVLCGHTHGSAFAQVADNIEVFTGGAAYGYPELQRSIELV